MRVNDELEASRSSTAVLFGLVGFAIGIGNVYRFPFVIAANGGGTALIIYIICLVLVAYPLFFFEMVAGYAVSKTPIETLTIISPRWTMLAVGQALMLLFQMGYFSASEFSGTIIRTDAKCLLTLPAFFLNSYVILSYIPCWILSGPNALDS